MNTILVIAQNTFRESVRDKVLYNLLFFAVLLVASSLIIGELSLNQEKLIIPRMGLSVMLFFGGLIAIFIGTGLVYKEIDKRTIYAMLAKPIGRGEFILGKFFGLGLTLLVNCLVMLSGILLSYAILSYNTDGSVAIAWALIPAGYLIFLQLLLIVAIGLLFSSFSSPALSITLSIIIYIIGSLSKDLPVFAQTIPFIITKYLALFLYYILPNFSNFNYITYVAQGNMIPLNDILTVTLYAVIYTTLLLVATIAIFQKRNFK
ncbi:MAG: ABC transporter permease subunit [Acidobacteria bacterium]|nr:ABC transporter permease subunit [Acidobacteriota bacterium]